MQTNGVQNAYVSYEKTSTTSPINADWVYAYANGTTTPATYLPWYTGYPKSPATRDRAVYAIISSSGVVNVEGESMAYPYVCEYGKIAKTRKNKK